jgi:hypothetical protein
MWGIACSEMNSLGDVVACDLVHPIFDVLRVGRGRLENPDTEIPFDLIGALAMPQ